LHPSGAFFIIDNKNLKLFDIYIKKRYYIKYKALKIKKIGENKVKKSTIAKFLLGTMVLPTALAGSCKAEFKFEHLLSIAKHLSKKEDRKNFSMISKRAASASDFGDLKPLELGIVSKYLDISNRKNLRLVNKKAGIALDQSCFLLDLSNYNCLSDHVKEINEKIKYYNLNHAGRNIQGTLIVSGGNNLYDLESRLLLHTIIQRSNVSIVEFNRIFWSSGTLSVLQDLKKHFPNLKITTKSIHSCYEKTFLDDLNFAKKLAEIVEFENAASPKMTFNIIFEDGLALAHDFLSALNYDKGKKGKIILRISCLVPVNDQLIQFLTEFRDQIESVTFVNYPNIENVDQSLKNLKIKKYFEKIYNEFPSYREEMNRPEINFEKHFSSVSLQDWNDVDLETIKRAKPLNISEFYMYDSMNFDLTALTIKQIENYFKERKDKIDALFDKELICLFRTIYFHPLEALHRCSSEQKKNYISRMMVEEMKHIAQRLKKSNGKLEIIYGQPEAIAEFLDPLNEEKNIEFIRNPHIH